MTPLRLPLVPADSDDPQLQPVFQMFLSQGRMVPTLYRALGNAPPMLRAWTALAWPLRQQAVTPRSLRELVILRIAQLTDAGYEWQAHLPAALEHGVSHEQVAALDNWPAAAVFDEPTRAVLTLTDELTVDGRPAEDTMQRLTGLFGPAEVVELVLTAAFYACVSRVLHALGIDSEAPEPTDRAATE